MATSPAHDVDLHILERRVATFVRSAGTLDAKEAERQIEPILRDLFAVDGYQLGPLRAPGYVTDFAAVNEERFAATTAGIEYKHYEPSRPVGRPVLDQLISAAREGELDRLVVISRSGFTPDASASVRRDFPVDVELIHLPELLGWVRRLISAAEPQGSRVARAVAAIAREFARAVAENPAELDQLEWRDVERMLAAVLGDLGFEAELTPPAKDGGKDIVLRLRDQESDKTYVVEIKHWRSGHHVGQAKITDFVEVVVREGHEGGLFLATHGYTQDAFAALSEIERTRVRFGAEDKVLALCRTYVKAERGLWAPASDDALAQLLFEGTTAP
jgi:restriction system protein